MTTELDTARYIKGLYGQLSACIVNNQMDDELAKKYGFTSPYKLAYEKGGVRFVCYKRQNLLIVGEKIIIGDYVYPTVFAIDQFIPQILQNGFQCDYVRGDDVYATIHKIKELQRTINSEVTSFTEWGAIGERLHNLFNCQVQYNGESSCTFYKDFLGCLAHTNDYPTQGWHLQNTYCVIFADNTISKRFAITETKYDINLERDFEYIFGFEPKEFGTFHDDSELE